MKDIFTVEETWIYLSDSNKKGLFTMKKVEKNMSIPHFKKHKKVSVKVL